jgi:hypothetical protein
MADRRFVVVMVVVVSVVMSAGCAQTIGGGKPRTAPEQQTRVFPWEWWRDLSTIAVVPDGDRTVMSSSFCPSGCSFDRHSATDPRFLRRRGNGEGVIFEAEGAGAITRIWMVQGDGLSRSLDEEIRLRIRIDGRRRPVVDLTLPELFDGEAPPFVAPLVADRLASGGGNISYVPIPFVDGCEVTLVGAEEAKIWFQVTARLVDDPSGLRPFALEDGLPGLAAVLSSHGGDPWPGLPYPTVGGSVVLAPGEGQTIASFDGADVVNGIIIRTDREHWNRLGLRFTFDDREPMLVPLMDLFGVIRVNQPVTRSLLFGADRDDDLYWYFPVPFFERAKIELMRRPVEGPPKLRAEYAIRRVGSPPPSGAGYLTIQTRAGKHLPSDNEVPVVELDGRGAWVGLFASFQKDRPGGWGFLEGDERVFVNQEVSPSLHGTGVEDFFGGGFYFRNEERVPVPFSQPLHGVSSVDFFKRPAPVMYRLMLGDGVVFENGVSAAFETVLDDGESMKTRSVAYVYQKPAQAD